MRTGHLARVGRRARRLLFTLAAMAAIAAIQSHATWAADTSWAEEMILKAQKDAEASVRRGNVRVAALGNAAFTEGRTPRTRSASIATEDRPQSSRRSSSEGSLRGTGSVSWVASASCLNSTLRNIVVNLAATHGPVRVNSTCRSSARNRSVGGASRSYHLSGNAVDFRVFGSVSAVYASLRSNSSVGGLKRYGGGLFHIDIGPRRSW
jgi:hypothetical protein